MFGVIDGTPNEPRVAYLKKSAVVDQAIFESLRDLDPKQVFRFAGKCEESHCVHFDGAKCSLAQRIVESLDAVVDVAPPCQIRPTCRWHAERGVEACRRCPQVITMIPRAKDGLNRVAIAGSVAERATQPKN